MTALTAEVTRDGVPDLVLELAAGRPLRPVWRNQIGGTTWLVGGPRQQTYLKVGPRHREFDPASDAERLAWAARWVPAPRVLSWGTRNGWGWLETARLPGRMAFAPEGGAAPELQGSLDDVLRALGRALRHFHEVVPVAECPWDWSAQRRAAESDPAAIAALGDFPAVPAADLVVCHADACTPNFLLHDDLTVAGYVDLGRCGVADRWADLAPASWSIDWNFGPGLSSRLLEGYGVGDDIPMDADRLAFYRRLWDAPAAG